MTGQVCVVDDVDEELSAPTRSLLFSPLMPTDAPSAVVHRLRAAIGLGLLADGKRLPKEAELAAQLGVTTFALRDALAELRKQGLLVTKAGKYGGSFVTYSAESEQLAQDGLASLSSVELRDIGDWRQMLAGHAAALAAHRASKSDWKALALFAARVGDADSAMAARRAHSRFFLQLASAAESMRLTRAEFAVHEQIDWLFGLALRTREERDLSTAGLEKITAAVHAKNPRKARDAAERHIAQLVNRLAQRRFEQIAAGRHDQRAASSAITLADEIAAIIDSLILPLDALAKEAAPALANAAMFDDVRRQISLAALQRIEALPAFVKGMGVIADVGVVPDHPYWIQWWQRTGAGPVADNHHVMDPAREDFYDYPSRDYFQRPKQTHAPCAHGPYLDYGGVDDYIVSVAVPILSNGSFYGVACADVVVADLEAWLAPLLASSGESYLLNGNHHVIVSNTVAHRVGDSLSNADGFEVVPYPELDWQLLVAKHQKF